LEKVLAIPTFLGIKPASERFAGATNSMTAEGMMRDGKALQLATSHELGQNFAKAFDIPRRSRRRACASWSTGAGAVSGDG
jgi:prolyl-tRNA synthetase